MKPTTHFVFIMSIIFSTSTLAATIDNRQDNQQDRIKDGIKSGELTKMETARLGKEQMKIKRKEMRFKSDGEFSMKERLSIQRDLNRQSKSIYRQKHDRQTRF
jgi:hypothetical protein